MSQYFALGNQTCREIFLEQFANTCKIICQKKLCQSNDDVHVQYYSPTCVLDQNHVHVNHFTTWGGM